MEYSQHPRNCGLELKDHSPASNLDPMAGRVAALDLPDISKTSLDELPDSTVDSISL